MKKLLSLLLLLVSVFYFSQVTIPNSSEKGLIITKTNEKIYYKNLNYSNGKVKFYNIQTQNEEFLYDASISEIKENEILMESQPQQVVQQKKVNPKLTSDADIKTYLLQHNDERYMKGKKINDVGTGFVAGGLTLFLVGGIANVSSAKANENIYNTSAQKKGVGPVPLVIGLIGAGAGVIMKVSGHSQMKNAIENYKKSAFKNFKENSSLVLDDKGFGLRFQF